jgi:hypothetical protein
MHSEPSKIVVTGIIVCTVAILAYVSQSERPWMQTEDVSPVRSDEPDHHTLGNMVSGVVTRGPVVTHGASSASTASAPPAHNSPPPSNPATVQASPNVSRPTPRNDAPVHADSEPHAPPTARVEHKPQSKLKPLRTSTPPGKHGASHERHSVAHQPAPHRATRVVQDQKGLDKLVTEIDSRSAPAATPPPPPVQPVPQQVQKMPPILPEPNAESTPPAAPPPAVQSAAPEVAPAQSAGAPATRAQVRTEIGRAREDGRLPAYGNPNPGGPGGTPSLINTPRP